MKDLEATSGLPLRLADDGRLVFGAGLPAVEPAFRTLAAMREVLAEPAAEGPDVLYAMYRDVARPEDRARLRAHGLRYDITVLQAARLGPEWNKTYGHYHPLAPDGEYYPEVYEVLAGRAIYLLQHRGPGGAIDDVLVIPAVPGDKVFMLPGYGHATINAADEPLVMANWVAGEFSSEYGDYRERHGAAYYALDGGEGVRWQPNTRYADLPEARVCAPLCPEDATALRAGRPMYPDGAAHPERLAYLVAPRRFGGDWRSLVEPPARPRA
jgi:glucose-6-phosphate isomerase